QLAEYDRNWNKVWSYPRAQGDIQRAAKMPNGNIAFISAAGTVNLMNAKTQNIISTFNVGNVGTYYGGLEVLPNGNLLIPLYSNHLVAEYTPNGQQVWRATTPWPSSAVRLPNGDVLVGSINTNRVVQLNRQGQEVWSRNFTGQVYRVRAY